MSYRREVEPTAGTRLSRVLQAGIDQSALETKVVTTAPTVAMHRPALSRLHRLGLEIEGKRKPEADPAAAGGDLDVDYQRLQSYYVCAQVGAPVLFVVKGWFWGDNRIGFDIMQRAAGLGLKLRTNDYYPLGSCGVSFDTSLSWYGEFYPKMNEFATTTNPTALFPLPKAMRAHVNKTLGESAFAAEFARLFGIEVARENAPDMKSTLGVYKHDDLRNGELGPMNKHRVPAKPDSMVFFTGPHMVVGDPVRRLAIFVHSLSENTAQDVLDDFPTYTKEVRAMQIPPNAQGKARSSLVDKYLKEEYGEWGWTPEQNPTMPAVLRSSLLIDKASILGAPEVAPKNVELVNEIRQSIFENSCFVAEDVLKKAPEVNGKKLLAADFEKNILGFVATIIDRGLAEQERLKAQLLAWLSLEPERVAALLAPPEDPKTHEKVLKARLKAAGLPAELKDYAENVLVRGVRKTESASWQKFHDRATTFRWPADPEIGNKKLLRTVEEVRAELQPAPTTAPRVADGPLAYPNGDMTKQPDLWQLVRNIGGQGDAVSLRRRLYLAGSIAHPHIGAWVSAKKPWCPPLANPVGSWQNVYQLLVLGMLDAHYSPEHALLRHALKPLIEQAWYATSRKPFTKVLFAPERFNLRELPSGGSQLAWHIDQDAIAPACAMAPDADSAQDAMGGFLADTSGGDFDPTGDPTDPTNDDPMDDVPLAERVKKMMQKS